jgi:hypothetical protein
MAVDKQLPQVSPIFRLIRTRLINSSSRKSTDGVSLTTPYWFPSLLDPSHTSVSHYTLCCSSLSYQGLGSGGPSQAFAWILALSTVAGLLAWMTLCICYLRFYAACKVQGLDRNTLPFKSRLQPYAGWVGAIGSLGELSLLYKVTEI